MNETVTNEIGSDTVPHQTPGYELQKSPCCYSLRNSETKNIIKLNDSSALIWQVCTGEWSVGEIIEVLQESYPDAESSMEADVHSALELLLKENALELRD